MSSFSLLWEGRGIGQIVRDGSLGQTQGALSGPQYTIDVQNAAQQIRGTNLFHSFSDFNVHTGQTATFTGPSSIANIINRVTGSNLSTIDGAVNARAAMPNANLFLMNPNGIMLGPNASFNIGGSIHLTTADVMRMGDGAQFFANLAKQSTLSSAPVVAFGFLGERTPGPITVQAGPSLTVNEGNAISLVGGDISISGRTIAAPGGQITVAAVKGAGEQPIAGVPPTISGASSGLGPTAGQGTIHLAAGAMLQTNSSTGHAGPIFIRGGKLIMEQASLAATTAGSGPNAARSASPGNVTIQAETVSLSNGSSIDASTTGAGKAGDIIFEVTTLRSNVGADGTPLSGAAPVNITSSSTGPGGAGTITIAGPAGRPADVVSLSNTQIVASVSAATIPTTAPMSRGEHVEGFAPQFIPTFPPPAIEITAEHVTLANGTVIKADTTGGADAGSIKFNVGTMATQAGPDGRVLISSASNCGEGCLGGQAGDITIQGIPGVTPSVTQNYIWVARANSEPTEVFTYHLAHNIDLQGTDIRSDAIGNAPGGIVTMRAHDTISLTGTTVSVATQDFRIIPFSGIQAAKPNGESARNQGFSRIDIMARDLVLKDSTIAADAKVSDLGSCPTCQGGPSAGEIWLRVQNSLTADNSSITNTGRENAQAGLVKIIKDNHFSYGAIWEPDYPDPPTNSVRLTNSEITVEAQNQGLPGYLRIRADTVILDHSVLNSKVNDVSNGTNFQGQMVDVVGAGERQHVVSDGRDVQGSIVLSAKNLDITGGGIIAPTQGSRIGSRIELHADVLNTHPGTRPGGTLSAPRILDPSDPTRVVISSGSSGSGGAGTISIVGESIPMPEGTPFTAASSIHLKGTDVMTDTRSDALGGKIEMKASGPIELHNTTISANVTDVRPQSAAVQDQGGSIHVTAGSLTIQAGGVSALSRGSQNGGNVVIQTQGPITLSAGATVSASNTGSGDAGSISLTASGPIEINAGRVATASMDGRGGPITIHGSDLAVSNGSAVTAASHGANNAGKIELISDNNIAVTNSAISTEALKASGGDIKLTAPGSVTLKDSTLTASVAGGNETTGGKIDIDPQYVIIQNSQVLAKAADGNGGRIAIEASKAVLIDPGSSLDATSSKGVNGQIIIQSPIQQLAGAIAPLPQAFAVAANLYGQRCAAQKDGQFSSFVQSARDGLPPQPGDFLASPLLWESHSGTADMGRQVPVILAAARLGLPTFEQMAPIFSPTSSGCPS
ncbi:MAG: filamentous hemagglutinin N-terminal domain-containing protein [Nitrospiraceae bacterium]